MGCERYEEELTDAAIGTPASPDLERHLASCAACRSRLEGERRLMAGTDRILRDVLSVEPSPGFEARLLRAVRHAAPAASRSWWALRGWTVPMAAGLGLLLVGGGLMWRWAWPAPSPRQTAAGPAVRASSPSSTAVESAVPVRGPESSPPVGAVEPDRVAEAPPRRPAVPPRPSAREPEVLVPPGREQALAQFVAMLRDERVEPPKGLTEPTDPQSLLAEPEPLEIPDLQPEVPSDTVLRDGRSES
jgi:hypothetical protein